MKVWKPLSKLIGQQSLGKRNYHQYDAREKKIVEELATTTDENKTNYRLG